MGLIFKLIFHPGTWFLIPGLVLIYLTYKEKLTDRPILRWLGPVLVPTGIGMYIPMWFWQDSAFLTALTLSIMGLNALSKRWSGLGIVAYAKSIPERWAKSLGL